MIRIGVDWRECEQGKRTGIGRYLVGLGRYLLRPGHEWDLRLFGNQKTSWESFIPDKVKRVIPEKHTVWWDQVRLPRAVREEHCHLLLTPYFKAPLFCRCPVVLFVNDLIPVRNLYFRLLLRQNLRRAAAIIVISETTKKEVIEFEPGIDSKTAVIPLGIDRRFAPGPAERPILREKLGIQGNYLLYVGNARRHKNVAALLQALKEIAGYELVLAGVDPLQAPELPRAAALEGLLPRVHFLPGVSDEDLVRLYRGADVFVFPSLKEGFGLPPLEAMACGVPVVSSRIPAAQEVLGEAACFVDATRPQEIARAVREIVEQPALRETWIQKGRARAAFFTEYEMASSMAGFLKAVHENRLRRSG